MSAPEIQPVQKAVRLTVCPLTLRQANAMVLHLHRHHEPAHAHRWSIGVMRGAELCAAAIVGRPVAHRTPQYSVAEVTRLVTDGTPHACSKLYAACARVAKAMGFEEIQTFILRSESGVSLVAAGWTEDKRLTRGGSWNRPSRAGRRDDQPQEPKRRWFKILTRKRGGRG